MTINLSADAEKLIEQQLESGQYESAEHAVLGVLAQQQQMEFEPGDTVGGL